MADFTPVEMTHRDGRVETASSLAEYYNLVWDGFTADGPPPEPPRDQLVAHLSDLDELVLSGGGLPPEDQTKLDGIQDGATANQTDAYLLDRAHHTGSQTSASISDLTETIQDTVAALLAGGTGVSVAYDDANGVLTLTSTATGGATDPEVVRDTIGVALAGVGLVSVVANDAGDTITISTTATQNSTDAQLRDRSTHTGTQSMSTIGDATAVGKAVLGALDAAAARNAIGAQVAGDYATSAQGAKADSAVQPDTVNSAVLAGFGSIMIPVAYTTAWPALGADLVSDASVGWHFIGGDEAHPPPGVAGPALWDRPAT